MKKLSNSDARTIRHARDAIELIISGAVRHLESDFGPGDMIDRTFAIDALLCHCKEAVDEWFVSDETNEDVDDMSLTISDDE